MNSNDSAITNCYAIGSVTGGDNSWQIGGLCSENNSESTISNCYATGEVTGGDSSGLIAGLCAENRGSILNSFATSLVTGGNSCGCLGGLCGRSEGGSVANSYASGAVLGGDGSYYIGGLCGANYDILLNCYSTGLVTGSDNVGGFCGYNEGSITNSYAVGHVSGTVGTEYCVGGLCGQSWGDDSEIINSFWDVETSGQESSAGGVGKNTAEMQAQSTFKDAGWDFNSEIDNGTDDIWHMPYGVAGYPMLYWQKDIPSDLTGKYGVDMEDVGVVAEGWLESFQISDLAELAGYWLEGK